MPFKKIGAAILAILSLIYILNPGFGFFELLPDTLPVIGNLDEASAAVILVWALKLLFGKGDGPAAGPKPPEKTVN